MYLIISTLVALLATAASTTPINPGVGSIAPRAYPFNVPFYNPSANGHTSSARGWNSFGFDSNKNIWSTTLGYDYNVYHFKQQCLLLKPRDGFDYYCSIDSGWSLNGGDQNGRIFPDPAVFDTQDFESFANDLNNAGVRLAIYVLPGAFVADADRLVAGTSTTIRSLFNLTVDGRPGISNQYNLRNSFNYGDPAQQGDIQKWHDSVVQQFASWGVEMIKLDYITPGSDIDPNVRGSNPLPADSSGAVIAYHNAIQNFGTNKFGRKMRLDISWRLDFDTETYWQIWKANADSLRIDRDINARDNPVTFGAIQRTVERYRRFINQQTLNNARVGQGINVRPDMDNLYVGNPAGNHDLSALTDTQRYTQAILWIGAGANLITGSDLRSGRIDALGSKLLFDDEPQFAASFTSQWPMQPRNPDDAPTPGGPDPRQLQAWISGPNDQGTAYVILTNLGEDQCWDGECSYATETHGVQLVSISLTNLGIGGSSWFVRRVLGGGGHGGPDYSDIGVTSDKMASYLDHYESALYRLQKCGTAGSGC